MAEDDPAHQEDLAALRKKLRRLEERALQLEATERALIASRESLQMVMDTIPQRIFWKDRELRYLGCNAGFAEDAGLASPEEIVGKLDFDLAWRESAHLYRADDASVMARGAGKINYEEPMELEDGSTRWVRTSKVPLRDEDGEVIGVFGCYENVSDRKLAEQALRESEERYRTLVEHASDGIILTDGSGRHLQVNPAACELLGYSEEELLGLTRDHLQIEDGAARAGDRLGTGQTRIRELLLRHKDGSAIPVEASAKQLPDGSRLAIVRDIAERRRHEQETRSLQEQLAHAQRLESVGRLAGGIAHDFNNLLTAILAYSDFLKLKLEAEDARRDDVELIAAAAHRAATLTGQLLAFSRKQVVQPRVLPLNEAVKAAESMLGRLLGEDVRLRVSLDATNDRIEIDPTQMEQIIVNLALNARDAMPRGGSLTFATSSTPETVILTVRDDGEGMDPDTIQHVFEPFFTTKSASKGTGLGLATVHGMVLQVGGSIEVKSAPGQGTTFVIALPLVKAPAASAEAIPEAPARETGDENGHGVILLVEDDVLVRRVARRVLEDGGFTVLAAGDAEEALRIVAEEREHLRAVISDVIMPGMNGVELAATLHEREPGLPVALMSGYTADALGDRNIPDEMILLRKPFTRASLLETVHRTIGGAAKRDPS